MKISVNKPCPCGSSKKYKKCCGEYYKESLGKTPNVLLVVGNGFTMNYLDAFEIDLDSRKPLTEFDSPSISYDDLFRRFPVVKKELESHDLTSDHFKIIKKIYDKKKNDEDFILFFEKFLTLAFSKFQLELNKSNHFNSWIVLKWLHINRSRLKSVLSLNYDLLLENSLNHMYGGKSHFRKFTSEEYFYNKSGVCILKPHGSIDFDILDGAIEGPKECFDTAFKLRGNVTRSGDVFLKVVNEKDLLDPRKQVDITPPSQENTKLGFSWIKEIYGYLGSQIETIDAVVNFGVSYREEDRREYNKLIDMFGSVSKKPIFVDINKECNEELDDHLKSLGFQYVFRCVDSKLPWRLLDII